MPTPATLEYVADLVVRRALIEASSKGRAIHDVLNEFYPFAEDDFCRRVWMEALRRHGLKVQEPPRISATTELARQRACGCSG